MDVMICTLREKIVMDLKSLNGDYVVMMMMAILTPRIRDSSYYSCVTEKPG